VRDVGHYRWIATHILPHEAEVRSWLRAHLRSLTAADIDDLMQEAFARVCASGQSNFSHGRAYLYTTVRHLVAEHARRHRIVPIELLGEIESLSIISEEPGPERRAGARQELERLRTIVAALPPQCRRVFELRKLEDLPQREIAKRMGIAEKTVENHLTRALATIHAALAEPATQTEGFALDARNPRPEDAKRKGS
jgi:RNA polymerase sigma factor (sigma-70 family)